MRANAFRGPGTFFKVCVMLGLETETGMCPKRCGVWNIGRVSPQGRVIEGLVGGSGKDFYRIYSSLTISPIGASLSALRILVVTSQVFLNRL